MEEIKSRLPVCLLLAVAAVFAACNGPANTKKTEISGAGILAPNSLQLDDYVVAILEDKKGNRWFGTVLSGVARFDGATLHYLTVEDGLPDNTVASIAEDRFGNIWLGTHGGLAKYDGKTITSFTEKDGLCNNRVANLLIDRAGMLWIGTWGGACRFDGHFFTKFDLPIPDVALLPYQNTVNWITEIMEDPDGNIWFGRDGYGACKYDGSTFTHFTKKEGLASNNVQAIHADKQGNIWFGCRMTENDSPDPEKRTGDGGLSRFDGKSFVRFPEIRGLSKNDSYAIEGDRSGNVWIGANKVGLYKYDGKKFLLFDKMDRQDLITPNGYGIQALLEDSRGILWIGLSGGLFRLEGSLIRNVTQDGPWP